MFHLIIFLLFIFYSTNCMGIWIVHKSAAVSVLLHDTFQEHQYTCLLLIDPTASRWMLNHTSRASQACNAWSLATSQGQTVDPITLYSSKSFVLMRASFETIITFVWQSRFPPSPHLTSKDLPRSPTLTLARVRVLFLEWKSIGLRWKSNFHKREQTQFVRPSPRQCLLHHYT